MNPRTPFLISQGWTLLVRDDEGGLWRSPLGSVLRAKEAEEVALGAMTVGIAYWLIRLDEASGTTKAAADLIKAKVAQIVFSEIGVMWADPGFQRRLMETLCQPESLGPLREFLQAVLAMPEEPKKDTVLQ